jgi:hypothetical protein
LIGQNRLFSPDTVLPKEYFWLLNHDERNSFVQGKAFLFFAIKNKFGKDKSHKEYLKTTISDLPSPQSKLELGTNCVGMI